MIPKTYPADIWTEATNRWQQLPDDQKVARREEQKRQAEEAEKAMQELNANFSRVASTAAISAFFFGPFDVLWTSWPAPPPSKSPPAGPTGNCGTIEEIEN